MVEYVNAMTPWRKRAISMAIDAVMLPFALWCAMVLRYGDWDPPGVDFVAFWPAFVVVVVAGLPAFGAMGLYRHVIRYMGWDVIGALVKGVTIATIAIIAVAYMLPMAGFPRSAPPIFWLLCLGYVAGTRLAARAYAERAVRETARKRVVIYGAGEAGAQLAQLLRSDRDYRPVAIIDADRREHGRVIHGLAVRPLEALPNLVREQRVGEVLVALSGASKAERERMLGFLEPYPVRVRIVPDFDTLIASANALGAARDIEITDLLGRTEVAGLPHLLRGSVAERSVLVTGAAGSIGSELCRQIVRLAPRKLVLLDQNEYALFRMEKQLVQGGLEAQVVAVLGSVLDRPLLQRALRQHRVDTVYHAAAYKHVGLVESNVAQGIKNNTFGTLYAAQAAAAAGVSRFILISTDKGRARAERHGGQQAAGGNRPAGVAIPGPGNALRGGAVRQRVGFVRLRRADISRSDRQRRPGDGYPHRRHPLLHDACRGVGVGVAGRELGQRRRGFRARHGRTGEHSRAGVQNDSLARPHGTRRKQSGRRHRH